MTREEHLRFCRVCTHQKFNKHYGIVCGLTDNVADFDPQCGEFVPNPELTAKHTERETRDRVMVRTASQGKRLANYLIDLAFIYIFSIVFGLVLGIVLYLATPDFYGRINFESKALDYLLGFVFGMLYYTVLEASTGRTIAKYMTKTKTVTETLEKPPFGAILIRSLCRFIPFEALSFLGSQGWHDKLSKTYVIDLKPVSNT